MGRQGDVLEWQPWRGFPSAALGGLQMGLAMDSKSRRAGTEPKQSRQVFSRFALQVFGTSVLYLGKVPLWKMSATNEAKQSKICSICDTPFWPVSFLWGFAEIQRPQQNCCNWCTLENRDAINSWTELEVEGTSEVVCFFFTATGEC